MNREYRSQNYIGFYSNLPIDYEVIIPN